LLECSQALIRRGIILSKEASFLLMIGKISWKVAFRKSSRWVKYRKTKRMKMEVSQP
jgi:hypothetical protein